jgi:protease I
MKKFFLLALAVLILIQAISLRSQAALQGKKVLMIIPAQNFRDEEYREPRQALEKERITVLVASTTRNEARGMLGLTVKPDLFLQQVRMEPYAGVIFVGGSGASSLWNNQVAHFLAREAMRQKKIIGAICMAPVTLARAGILKGKTVSSWKDTRKMIEKNGATWSSRDLSVSGNIITASGPSAAPEFARAFIALLKKGR